MFGEKFCFTEFLKGVIEGVIVVIILKLMGLL